VWPKKEKLGRRAKEKCLLVVYAIKKDRQRPRKRDVQPAGWDNLKNSERFPATRVKCFSNTKL